MQTQVIGEPSVSTPWLEHAAAGDVEPRRTALETFPFSIGRSDTSDLRIDSSRVSRDHAAIVWENGQYAIRDFGSTNGTFLNGQQISESPLSDGDLLVVADMELTFFAGTVADQRDMATQVLTSVEAIGGDARCQEIIQRVRLLHEQMTRRAVQVAFRPIVRLAGDETVGYEAVDCAGEGPGTLGTSRGDVLGIEWPPAGNLRELIRCVATEEISRLPGTLDIHITLDASEIGAGSLTESVQRLREVAIGSHRLVIKVPDSTVCDTRYFRNFHSSLRKMGVGIVYTDFAGGPSQLSERREFLPDALKLASSMTRNLDHNANQRRQIEAFLGAADDLGCQVIVSDLNSERDVETAREMGFQLGQGTYLGQPQSIEALLEKRHA